jgi:uncharacterized protein YggE
MQISKNLLLLIVVVVFMYSFTNNQNSEPSGLGFIEVIGSSEMEIQPDEIEFEIKIIPGSNITIEKSEKRLFKVLSEHGIPKKNVRFTDLNNHNYWYYWWHYRNYNYKTFAFTLSEKTDLFELVKEFNPKWVSHLRVSKTTHSNIHEYRKQVKIDAMKAAKTKASYLLNSVDQKAGLLVEVVEINADKSISQPYWYYNQNLTSNTFSNSNVQSVPSTTSNSSNEMDGVKAIKLRYEIKTKFQIL